MDGSKAEKKALLSEYRKGNLEDEEEGRPLVQIKVQQPAVQVFPTISHEPDEIEDDLFASQADINDPTLFFFSRGSFRLMAIVFIVLVILNAVGMNRCGDLLTPVGLTLHYTNENSLIYNIQLLYWCLLLDAIIFSYQFLWLLSRFVFLAITQLYMKAFVFYGLISTVARYERNIRWIIWGMHLVLFTLTIIAVFLFSFYPLALHDHIVNTTIDSFVWSMFKSILAIAIVYTGKHAILYMLEVNLFFQLDRNIDNSIYLEHLIMRLEDAPVQRVTFCLRWCS